MLFKLKMYTLVGLHEGIYESVNLIVFVNILWALCTRFYSCDNYCSDGNVNDFVEKRQLIVLWQRALACCNNALVFVNISLL